MSNFEDDYKRIVNVKKVVRAVKKIGNFAMYSSSEDSTLLITEYFILNLNELQSWEIQCALLVKELGKWYTVDKEGPIAGKEVEQEKIDSYYRAVNAEGLEIVGFTELYLNNISVYAADGKFVGIKRDYMEMLGDMSAVRKSPFNSYLVVSESHLIAPAKQPESIHLAPMLF